MVIPPIPPAYTRLLIKKSPTDMVISNFAKKSGGDKYTPPFHICNIYNVILTYKKDITLTHTYSAS